MAFLNEAASLQSVFVLMYKRSVATLICPFAPFLVPKPASHVFRRTFFTPTSTRNVFLRRTTSKRPNRRKKESLRYNAQANAAQGIVGGVQVWAQKVER